MNKNITMVKGDTLGFIFTLEDINGTDEVFDLTTCYFSCKTTPNDTSTYVFQKALNDGITKVDDNQYQVRVAPSDTYSLTAGDYYYDLQIGIDSDILTVMKGVLRIEQDVTRNTVA